MTLTLSLIMRNSIGNKVKVKSKDHQTYDNPQNKKSLDSIPYNFYPDKRRTIALPKYQNNDETSNTFQNNRKTFNASNISTRNVVKPQLQNDHECLNKLGNNRLKLNLLSQQEQYSRSQQKLKDDLYCIIDEIQHKEYEQFLNKKRKQFVNLRRKWTIQRKQYLNNLTQLNSDFNTIIQNQIKNNNILTKIGNKKIDIQERIQDVRFSKANYLYESEPLLKQLLLKDVKDNKQVERVNNICKSKKKNFQQFLQSQWQFINDLNQPISQCTSDIEKIRVLQKNIENSQQENITLCNFNKQLKTKIQQNAYKNYSAVQNYLQINSQQEWESITKSLQSINNFNQIIVFLYSHFDSFAQLKSVINTTKSKFTTNEVENTFISTISQEIQQMSCVIYDKKKQIQNLTLELETSENIQDAEVSEYQTYFTETLETNNRLSHQILQKQKIINSLQIEFQRCKRDNNNKSNSEILSPRSNIGYGISQFKPPLSDQFSTATNPFKQACCHCKGNILSNALYCFDCSNLAHSSCVHSCPLKKH